MDAFPKVFQHLPRLQWEYGKTAAVHLELNQTTQGCCVL